MSLEAKVFRIFRNTAETDNILTPVPDPFDDKIDFNIASSKDTTVENAFVLNCVRNKPEGLGINLTAEKPDGIVQPLQVIEEVWTITGFISNMRGDEDDGDNAFIALLEEWKDGEQATNDLWEAGRFGIQDFSNSSNTLIPVRTGSNKVGLIFADYQTDSNYNKNEMRFTLTFRKSRGLDV